jgi:hypothetical protein
MVLHLSGLGRIDLSGMLMIHAVLDDLDLPVTLGDVPEHSRRLVARVLPEHFVVPDTDCSGPGGTGGRVLGEIITAEDGAEGDGAR